MECVIKFKGKYYTEEDFKKYIQNIYWDNEKDLLTEDKIDIEAKATIDTLKQNQKYFNTNNIIKDEISNKEIKTTNNKIDLQDFKNKITFFQSTGSDTGQIVLGEQKDFHKSFNIFFERNKPNSQFKEFKSLGKNYYFGNFMGKTVFFKENSLNDNREGSSTGFAINIIPEQLKLLSTNQIATLIEQIDIAFKELKDNNQLNLNFEEKNNSSNLIYDKVAELNKDKQQDLKYPDKIDKFNVKYETTHTIKIGDNLDFNSDNNLYIDKKQLSFIYNSKSFVNLPHDFQLKENTFESEQEFIDFFIEQARIFSTVIPSDSDISEREYFKFSIELALEYINKNINEVLIDTILKEKQFNQPNVKEQERVEEELKKKKNRELIEAKINKIKEYKEINKNKFHSDRNLPIKFVYNRALGVQQAFVDNKYEVNLENIISSDLKNQLNDYNVYKNFNIDTNIWAKLYYEEGNKVNFILAKPVSGKQGDYISLNFSLEKKYLSILNFDKIYDFLQDTLNNISKLNLQTSGNNATQIYDYLYNYINNNLEEFISINEDSYTSKFENTGFIEVDNIIKDKTISNEEDVDNKNNLRESIKNLPRLENYKIFNKNKQIFTDNEGNKIECKPININNLSGIDIFIGKQNGDKHYNIFIHDMNKGIVKIENTSSRLQKDSVDKFIRNYNIALDKGNISFLKAINYNIDSIINNTIKIEKQKEININKNKFEYKGITIPTDFELTEEQDKALKDLIDFVENENSKEITLSGYAGTGKTSIIKYLERYIKSKKHNVGFIYSAPTHAATIYLALNIKQLPFTVQSMYSNRFNTLLGKNELILTKKTRKKFLEHNKNVVVIDESSMISNKTFQEIRATIGKEAKIIFMGDKAQIPSVDGQIGDVKNISPIFTEIPNLQLTDVKRTNDKGILEVLTTIRNNTIPRVPVVENTETLSYNRDEIKFVNEAIETIKKDPDNTIYISYTNKSVEEFNKIVRKRLDYKDGLEVGESILGYGGYNNKTIESGNLSNSIKYKVTRIEKEESGVVNISFESDILNSIYKSFGRGRTNYYNLSNKDALNFEHVTDKQREYMNMEISSLMSSIYEAKLLALQTQNKKNWSNFYSIQENVSNTLKNIDLGSDYIYNPNTQKMEIFSQKEHSDLKKKFPELFIGKGIDYGYAITVHKSQGSTYKNVFYDATSTNYIKLYENGNFINTEGNALNYVGMSRASEKLNVLLGDNIIDLRDNKIKNNTDITTEVEYNEEKSLDFVISFFSGNAITMKKRDFSIEGTVENKYREDINKNFMRYLEPGRQVTEFADITEIPNSVNISVKLKPIVVEFFTENILPSFLGSLPNLRKDCN